MDWEFVFISGRWHHLHAEFYGLNGTSIMESVMLRSGAQLHLWEPEKSIRSPEIRIRGCFRM